MFHEVFPQYLAMGMTYELFWDEDCMLVRDYRKAFKIRQEQMNYAAWLQGMYFYEALCDVSPVLHAFAKNGTRVRPYSDKPYEFKPAKPDEDDRKREMKRGIHAMESIAARFNQSFARKQEVLKTKAGKEAGPDG